MPTMGSGNGFRFNDDNFINNEDTNKSEVNTIMEQFELKIKWTFLHTHDKWEDIEPKVIESLDLGSALEFCASMCKEDTNIVEIRLNRLGSLQGFYVRGNGS